MTDNENDAYVELAHDHDSEVAFALYVGIAIGLVLGASIVLLFTWLL